MARRRLEIEQINQLLNKERSLIQRARALHDREAYGTLMQLHHGKVRAFLIRLCHHHALADDLAQDTFVSAFEKLDTFKGSGSFSGWLFRIAYNKFLQRMKDETRREEITMTYGIESEVHTEFYEDMSANQIDLEYAMRSLKPEQAAAISLCHSYGYSHREAADILDIPVGTVKTNILRGKTELRTLLNTKTTASGSK